MSKCASCGGCSGCGLELELTEEEIGFLRRLGECAFFRRSREKGLCCNAWRKRD